MDLKCAAAAQHSVYLCAECLAFKSTGGLLVFSRDGQITLGTVHIAHYSELDRIFTVEGLVSFI